MFPEFQSAYRKYHSTETALLRMRNDILVSMNKQQVTLLVFLDLSAAFDTVDHDILREIRLENVHRGQTYLTASHSQLRYFCYFLISRRDGENNGFLAGFFDPSSNQPDYSTRSSVQEHSYAGTPFTNFEPISSEGIKKLVLNAPNRLATMTLYLPRVLKTALMNSYRPFPTWLIFRSVVVIFLTFRKRV